MEKEMLDDPFNFDPRVWISENRLWADVRASVYQDIRKVSDFQQIHCNKILRKKPGILPITRQLIQERLTADELRQFDSWSGYQTIVDHINQIPRWGYARPHKTPNLLLVGPPNTGKSTLVIKLEQHCPVYPLGTKGGWFPKFQSNVYTLLSWDEFHLRCYPYPDLLKLLEGRPMKLPQKGGHVARADNQLIIATSNLTMREHVENKFKSVDHRQHSMANLKARFTEVVIPHDRPLFLLCKLILISSDKN